ncbi:hypothetical protein L1049_014388 [Liquidambar formosana]|uniref:Sugar phosphate transporter domain-containing protein n=1 Tax=Liquidambar formosana TaxID=63359 RepID=A0AAP0WZJ3_LIQFO
MQRVKNSRFISRNASSTKDDTEEIEQKKKIGGQREEEAREGKGVEQNGRVRGGYGGPGIDVETGEGYPVRCIYSKKAMTDRDSTNLDAYISIIALFVCIPPAILLAANTLERVAPLTHAVGNVLKRVLVIGFSIIVFGNKISTQTGIGTCIAITGMAIYSYIKARWKKRNG